MADYRESLADYVCDPRDAFGAVSECPTCGCLFKEPDFDICESRDGDEFFGVCPECGGLVKFCLYFTYGFDENACTPEEFEEATGEVVPKEDRDE